LNRCGPITRLLRPELLFTGRDAKRWRMELDSNQRRAMPPSAV
jgi:hypothetical protein